MAITGFQTSLANDGSYDVSATLWNLFVLSCMRVMHLGGSRTISLPLVASAQNVPDWIDVEVNGDDYPGLNVKLRVECRSDNAATAVTPKLRNVTDGTDAATGAACSAVTQDFSGANCTQSVVVTLASGKKKYRLQGTPSNALHAVYCIGYLEIGSA